MKNLGKKSHKEQDSDIFVLCLNPRCPRPTNRCLDGCTIRTHPTDCSRYYYSADMIMETPWQEIPDYPSDPIGMAVGKKIDKTKNESFF